MDTTTQPCHLDFAATLSRAGAQDHLATGALGEELAVRHLREAHGCTIVARNWRCAVGELRGELDVVAAPPEGCDLWICEVKTRRDAQHFGGAVAALSPRKRAQVRRLAAAYLHAVGGGWGQVRLDLIAVDLGRMPTLTHLGGAL